MIAVGNRMSEHAMNGVGPEQLGIAGNATRIDRDMLAGFLPRTGGWRDNAVPLSGGRIRFRAGRITSGLTVTASECRSRDGFRSRVEHARPVAILAFGLAGTSHFGFDSRTPPCTIQPGDVWLFRASDSEIIRATPGQAHASMVALKFDAGRIEEVLEEVGLSCMLRTTEAVRLGRTGSGQPGPRRLLENPLQSPLDRLAAESTALGLLSHWLAPISPVPAPDDIRLAPEERRGLTRVIDLLRSDLCRPLPLERLALEAGMSHPRLNRCFRKAYGKTVFEWLRDHRLDQAGRHLREDGRSITEIAYVCGFSSPSHFAAAFRARYGCSPAFFRRRFR
jgi:AraC family transcriptional regulator